MSYSEFCNFLEHNGKAINENEGADLALNKADALIALAMLEGTNVAILGGDVYKCGINGKLSATYDNWYINQEQLPPRQFAENSQLKAKQYLESYKEIGASSFLYVLVFDLLK
jgi:hypothetical protein